MENVLAGGEIMWSRRDTGSSSRGSGNTKRGRAQFGATESSLKGRGLENWVGTPLKKKKGAGFWG